MMKVAAKFLSLRRASLRKRVWYIIIGPPLEGKCFEVRTAGHSIFRGGPQWCDDKIIQKAFESSPTFVSSMIGFHDP